MALKPTLPVLSVLLAASLALPARAAGLRVLCSTFPIYQITRNVVQDQPGLSVALMIPADLGCPHHYALTPRDMRELAAADVLVINGLGMEGFLESALRNANPALTLVDSSTGIHNLLCGNPGCPHAHASVEPAGAHGELPAGDKRADAGIHRHHHPNAFNPHLFASPDMAARLAATIADGLATADPQGAERYRANAKRYAQRLNTLAADFAALGKRLRNPRVVQPHGVFDYLARDIGLEIVAVTQPHGHEPSAADMLALIRTLRETDAGAILTEPQYPRSVADILARETGIPVIMLDPVASGPDKAALDHYEQVMRRNLEALDRVLGGGQNE